MSKAIIIVSFGTVNLEGLKVIEDFEAEVAAKFSGNYRVYKVFTSSVISNLLLNKHGKVVPRLEEVLFRLNNEKYKEVYIQPLHIINGNEYNSIEKTIKEYDYSFSKIILGEALIGNRSDEENYSCNLICDAIKENVNEKDNILLIGHGSKTVNYNVYNCLKNNLKEKGYKNTYIGTLEGEVKKEDIVKSLIKDKVKDVTIIPILMLPGSHIKKDIFGSENSWKVLLENEGISVKSIEKSLLQYSDIREYYMHKIEKHLFER